jgi:phosphosulfolactate phosphohydrolase-like enzyme
MGWEGAYKALEDELFAEYLESRLNGDSPNFEEIVNKIKENPNGMKFFDKTQSHFKERDFHLAMNLDLFNFAIRVERKDPFFYTKV